METKEKAMRVQTTARPLGKQSQPAPAQHTLFGSIELMGASMSFKKGAEIYGENEPAD